MDLLILEYFFLSLNWQQKFIYITQHEYKHTIWPLYHSLSLSLSLSIYIEREREKGR